MRFFQILLLLAVAFYGTSVAQAGTSHDHHGKTDVASPFEQLDNGKPLHCVLNLHEHFQNIPCPHKGQGGINDQTEFRPDCGSQPGSANSSSSSFAKNIFKNATHYDLMPVQLSSAIKLSFVHKNQHHPRLIDHPPQFA
ncbi:MAG: hypothetical protein ISR86_04990 [Nitrospinaceae bacterium]|nr:hypothetical protein [Nitrospinaceae bacterium]